VLLDHPDLGALLRPKDYPFSVRPLEPMCMAAREGSVEDMRGFLASEADAGGRQRAAEVCGVDGKEPLCVAAAHGHVQCCLLLLEVGARLRGQQSLAGLLTLRGGLPGAARALIDAVEGRRFEEIGLDVALALLSEEDRLSALSLVAQAMPATMNAAAPAPQAPPAVPQPPQPQGAEAVEARGHEDGHQHRPSSATLRAEVVASQEAWVHEAGAAQWPAAERPRSSDVAAGADDGATAAAAGASTVGMPLEASPLSSTLVDVPRGVVHEVLFKMVFVRAQPDARADPVSSLKQGDLADVVDFDRSWGRVEIIKPQGLISGWVLLEHPAFGTLLTPFEIP